MDSALLQNQVEWVLETEGPLATMHLVKIINAFPANTFKVHQVSQFEIFVRSILNQLRENGKIYFDVNESVWYKVKSEESKPTIEVEQLNQLGGHLKIGEGTETVYCIYKSLSRYKAAISGEDRWPMKIGKTTRPVNSRLSELRTSSEEAFVIGLEIATEGSQALEAALHNKLQYCRIETQGAGTEWFWSNLEEVLNHYHAMNQLESVNAHPKPPCRNWPGVG